MAHVLQQINFKENKGIEWEPKCQKVLLKFIKLYKNWQDQSIMSGNIHLDNKIILKCKCVLAKKIRVMITKERTGGAMIGMRHAQEELLGKTAKF